MEQQPPSQPRFCGRCGQGLSAEEAARGPVHQVCPPAASVVAVPPPKVPAAVPAPSPVPVPTPVVPARPTPQAKPRQQRPSWRGRPREFPSVGAWLAGSCLRNWQAVLVGFVAAWFNLPLVIVMATVGAFLGGLAGFFSGSAFGEGVVQKIDLYTNWILPLPVSIGEMVPRPAWMIGGIIGAAWAAIAAGIQLGWIAFYWPWEQLFAGDPAWPVLLIVGQTVTALVVGTSYMVWSVGWEGSRLKREGVRDMSRRESEWMMPIVEEVATRMGLRGLPRIKVTDSREVNAFATTRHVVIHKGLLAHLDYDREAVAAVVCHELAHWRYADTVGKVFLRGIALPLYLGYGLAQQLERIPFRPIVWILSPLMWGVTVCVRYMVAPVASHLERKHEFRADQVAFRAGYGEGLRTALESFADTFDGALNGWDEVILRSHPYTELRLEAIEEEGRDYPLVPGGRAGAGAVRGAAAVQADSSTRVGW